MKEGTHSYQYDENDEDQQRARFTYKLATKLSYLTHGVVNNNRIGNVVYSILIIIEHVFMAFLLLLASYPVNSYADILDTRNLRILGFKDNSTTILAFSIAVYAFVLGSLFIISTFLVSIKYVV